MARLRLFVGRSETERDAENRVKSDTRDQIRDRSASEGSAGRPARRL